ncbi:MAG: O-antigen ligase family protein [Hyphomicrobiaceae bacterium]|nr:O-antigen ligase family protein [Hyphomicrobiaceae bacterium]
MLTAFYALVIAIWFSVAYVSLPHRRRIGLLDSAAPIPAVLLLAYFNLPFLFLVERTNGTAVLEQGLSISNLLAIAVVGLSVIYLARVAWNDGGILHLPSDRIVFPFSLAIAFAFVTTLWSVVPAYTLYRATELATLFAICFLLLDRERFGPVFIAFFAIFIATWLLGSLDTIASHLASGIFVSSAKNNMTPLMCLSALLYLYLFPETIRHRNAVALLFVVGFVAGGSAATTAAVPLILTGLMAASSNPVVRRIGWFATIAYFALIIFLLGSLRQFPEIMEGISQLLQKPIAELEKNTGRSEFWPAYIEAGSGRLFGAGFAAGERFIQLVDADATRRVLGDVDQLIRSAHNTFIGAWITMGWVGICLLNLVLGSAVITASRLDNRSRAFVYGVVFLLAANGMTTPGVLSEFNEHTMTLAAVLAFLRNRLVRPEALEHPCSPAFPNGPAPSNSRLHIRPVGNL